ncbi:hypothetical protein AB4144_35610, partial [Rhizobiaceae sp. 2RAB30]
SWRLRTGTALQCSIELKLGGAFAQGPTLHLSRMARLAEAGRLIVTSAAFQDARFFGRGNEC